jgi:DNA-binding NarL/FixJ family response regulator
LVSGISRDGGSAAALVLSNHTVKSHINRIFAKTRSRDRAAATQYAQTHNLSWG